MTITNKKLAKQIANTIKMIDVKLWEKSSKENVQLAKTRMELWQSVISLGYQIQADYSLLSNSVSNFVESVDLPQDEEYPSKTVQIAGHTVKYWYEDGFGHEIIDDDSDFDDIKAAVIEGYIEGEFCTYEDEHHNFGYWEIVKK